jgi:hypothetical protein
MNLTPTQRRLIEKIVNVFETGRAAGDYGAIAIYKDGPHGLSGDLARYAARISGTALTHIVELFAKNLKRRRRLIRAALMATACLVSDDNKLPMPTDLFGQNSGYASRTTRVPLSV